MNTIYSVGSALIFVYIKDVKYSNLCLHNVPICDEALTYFVSIVLIRRGCGNVHICHIWLRDRTQII